jgi:predicted O-methyltransferase YrrM
MAEATMRFDDVWMQQWQTGMLAELASRCRDNGASIEIGTHQGLSAIPIANAIYPKILHVVDHWEGSTDFRDYMRERDNYSIFIDNMKEGTQGNIKVHKQDWRDFAKEWYARIGFLHLDAEHTKDEVSAQIGDFLSCMPIGSILAGDDFNWTGVREAVLEQFKSREVYVMHNKLWWVEF